MNDNPTEKAVLSLLVSLGLDVTDEHLCDTPKRITNFYRSFLDRGQENFRFTTFESSSEDIVVVTHIRFYSMCSHHFVPFFGEAHVAYLPNGRLAGLSKVARTIRMFSHRPQVQERLTRQVAEYLDEKLQPRGVGVLMQAEHLCMSMRGVQVPDHQTITECLLGEMDNVHNRRLFHEYIQLSKENNHNAKSKRNA